MPLWSKGIKRSETGEIRKEDDLKNMIDEFFSNQEKKVSYEIVDDKNWIVNVDGSIHLNQSDLDDGKLFFKIGKLTNNLYFHGKHMSPSVIPEQMDGDIIFVPDEEGISANKGQNGNIEDDELDMGYLSANPMSKSKVSKKLEEAITEMVYSGYDIDIDEIRNRIEEQWKNKENYELTLRVAEKEPDKNPHVKKQVSSNIKFDFYIDGMDNDKPLDLTAIEKAVYIVFILHKDGLLLFSSDRFKKLLQKVYSKIHGRVQDDENGIMAGKFSDTSLLTTRTEIRKAIKEQISNARVVDEFAIEGKKSEKFNVQKATDELRKQIVKLFGLENEFPNLV
ncbi:MAG: hypothetical protein J1E16_05910 [Muribaculaceae bacterium]|nr:hypothetical protein [Muribaculaceae bacterium]